MSQIKKLRHIEDREFAQGHTLVMVGLEFNPHSLTPDPVILTTLLSVSLLESKWIDVEIKCESGKKEAEFCIRHHLWKL